MNNNKYTQVYSILDGKSIGCINFGDKQRFDEVAKEILGYQCFGNIVYTSLIDRLAATIKEMRGQKLVNEEFDCFDVFCHDKDYQYALQIGTILFPEVISYCEHHEDGSQTTYYSVYHFHKLNRIDIENICDMFADSFSENISDHLSRCETSEQAYEIIVNGLFILPF